MKNFFLSLFLIFLANVSFSNEKIKVYFFLGENCIRCSYEKKFLEKMEKGVDASDDWSYIYVFGWSGQVKKSHI